LIDVLASTRQRVNDDEVTRAFECLSKWADYQVDTLAAHLGADPKTLTVSAVEVSDCESIANTSADGRFFLWDHDADELLEYRTL
jgi:hypothetical protein